MSDELPETGSDHAPMEVAPGGSSNGVHHDGAVAVAPAIAPEGAGADPATATPEVETSEVIDATADAIPSDAVATTPDDVPDDGSAFLADLVKAMQTTAAGERARLGEDADRRRDAHVAAVEARRAAEVERMRELAADDLKGIDGWAEDERKRIQAEHDRRAAALQADLETSLAQHSGRIERELAAVHDAITRYRADVDSFFTSLDRESDPVAIARQASQRPPFPALETIGAEASAEPADAATNGSSPAIADGPDATDAGVGPGIAVMADPATLARGVQKLSVALTASREPAPVESGGSAELVGSAETAGGEAPVSSVASADDAAPVAEARVSSGGSTGLLQAVPISRPMSWLRRDRDQDHQER